MTQVEKPAAETSLREDLRGYASIVVSIVAMFVLLFWPAGTIDWRRAWLFMTLFIVLIFVGMSWIKRDNPELIKVREKYQAGTKGWDAIVATVSVILFALILPVAGLGERFQWAIAPDWVTLLGYVALTSGFMGTTWAQSVNRHFEATVRIQTDRDHKVIDTGPYAYIRHPGYAFGLLMAAGCALSLGSFAALIPVGLAMIAPDRTDTGRGKCSDRGPARLSRVQDAREMAMAAIRVVSISLSL